MKHQKQISYITEKLAYLRSLVQSRASLNLTDINIACENFYCQLFNIVYGYELININSEKPNYSAIDLRDSINRVAIQITSTKELKKIEETVGKFIKNQLYKDYDRLVIFNIVEKSSHRIDKYGDENFYFSTKKDVWDYSDLTLKINSLDDNKLNALYEYMLDQFDGFKIIDRRLPSDYRNRIKMFRDSYLRVENKLSVFGGREREMENLNQWLGSQSDKYFLLTSPAGRGKTALILHWIESIAIDYSVCFMPISIRFETNKPLIFYESMACQLAGLLNLKLMASEYEAVEYYKERVFEYIDLIEKSERKVLVIVDGLDEATGWQVSENLFSGGRNKNLKFLVSARVLSDKASDDWLQQLGWIGKAVQSMEVSLLSLESVKELLIEVEDQGLNGELIEDYAIQLFRLTNGEPFLLNLYIVDLLASAQKGELPSPDKLKNYAPGFDAYFRRWMEDQKVYNGASPFDEEINILLAVFSCAMGPMYLTDLEDIISRINGQQYYLEGEKLLPIQRFLVGDGVSTPYSLTHPLFGIFLREQYFKTSKRIVKTNQSIINWGGEVISLLESNHLIPKSVPPYLLQFYSQHLQQEDAGLTHFEQLICNGWRKAHLEGESRHLGFIREIEQVLSKAKKEYDLQRITLADYCSIMGKCSIFSSSINGMGRNLPPKLRFYAIKYNLMTVGQSLKQIDALQNENKSQVLIEIAKYLNAEQISMAIDVIGLTTNLKNKKMQYAALLKQLNTEQHESFKLKINGILGELNKYKEEPFLGTLMSSLVGIDETYLVSSLENLELYNEKVRFELDGIRDGLNTYYSDTSFFNEFNIENNFRSRMHLVERVIVNGDDLPPIGMVNLLVLHANLVLGVSSKFNDIGAYDRDKANFSLLLSVFIKLAIEEDEATFSAHFNKYLIQASERKIHFYEVDMIKWIYKVVKSDFVKIGVSEEIEKNIISVFNKLPTGNNRAHAITEFIPLINDVGVCKEAIKFALISSEFIEDESSQISFLTSIASITKDINLKENALEDAFKISCCIPFIHQKLSAFISLIKVTGSSSRDYYIEEMKKILKLNYESEIKTQYYWQLFELIDGDLDQETYTDMLNSMRDMVVNWQWVSWLRFDCIKKYLKPEDLLEFLHWVLLKEDNLEHKIQVLKDLDSQIINEYASRYRVEVEGKENSPHKCRILSLLGDLTNDVNFHLKALNVANDLDNPKDKLQAYSNIDAYIPAEYYSRLFEKAVNLLAEFNTEVEYKKSLLLILSLNGRTYEFMNKALDDYAHSDAYEFKVSVLSSLSSRNKRPNAGDDILIAKLISTIYEVIGAEEQTRIFSSLFPILNRQDKLKFLPMLLYRSSKASRVEVLGFITSNLDYLYELGGEQLLISLKRSLNDASDWWP